MALQIRQRFNMPQLLPALPQAERRTLALGTSQNPRVRQVWATCGAYWPAIWGNVGNSFCSLVQTTLINVRMLAKEHLGVPLQLWKFPNGKHWTPFTKPFITFSSGILDDIWSDSFSIQSRLYSAPISDFLWCNLSERKVSQREC